jgi:hypothetical protein
MGFKRVTGAALAICAMAAVAQAAEEPIVTKHNQTGFTTALGRREEVCSVYRDRVVILRRFGTGPGSFEQRERQPITVSRGVVEAARRALAEDVESTPNPTCDGPITRTVLGPLESDEILFHTGGCGSDRQERQGPHSEALRDLVDTYCPLTHEFPLPDPGPGGE